MKAKNPHPLTLNPNPNPENSTDAQSGCFANYAEWWNAHSTLAHVLLPVPPSVFYPLASFPLLCLKPVATLLQPCLLCVRLEPKISEADQHAATHLPL